MNHKPGIRVSGIQAGWCPDCRKLHFTIMSADGTRSMWDMGIMDGLRVGNMLVMHATNGLVQQEKEKLTEEAGEAAVREWEEMLGE